MSQELKTEQRYLEKASNKILMHIYSAVIIELTPVKEFGAALHETTKINQFNIGSLPKCKTATVIALAMVGVNVLLSIDDVFLGIINQ